jgi:hypothetical protein
LECDFLLGITPVKHGALLSMRGRRERERAFSSPMKATIRAVMIGLGASAVQESSEFKQRLCSLVDILGRLAAASAFATE